MVKYLFIFLFIFSCVENHAKRENTNIFQEYINNVGRKVVKYGDSTKIDSTKIYTSEGKLSFEKYMYGNDIPIGAILERGYYDNGKFSYIEINTDTIMIIEDQEFNVDWLILSYHENGILSGVDYFWGGNYVGTTTNYDTLGTKIEERFSYPNLEDKEKAYVKVKEFYTNGDVKSEKMYYYFAEDDYPIGTWKYYNEKGKLIKEDVYVDGEIVNK